MWVENIEREKFEALRAELDERAQRLWAAAEARSLGRGGIAVVARATGMTPERIQRGLKELDEPRSSEERRVRRPGAGRKRKVDEDEGLMPALEKLIEPTTRGDPESSLRWTCKSTRKLANELSAQGHEVSYKTVERLLAEANYSLQGTRKTLEGSKHEDRDAQFNHIYETVNEFQSQQQPVISVDCKKKELVGQFSNKGQEWQPKGQPEKVNVHDFIDPELGKAIPYGVYDITNNNAWVSVGVDHDTADFAVETINCWWKTMGKIAYPEAKKLYITSDGGGSNGWRLRLWKAALQQFADNTGLTVQVSHLPPGTSKWNKIEHRLFSYITQNWRGRPLASLETIVNLIANTRTEGGLKVRAALDLARYPTGKKVTNEEMAKIKLSRDEFHGEWNYQIAPRSSV